MTEPLGNHRADLCLAIGKALVPKNEFARAGVWMESLFAEVAYADFESYSDFCFELAQMEKAMLVSMSKSDMKARQGYAEIRYVRAEHRLIKLIRSLG